MTTFNLPSHNKKPLLLILILFFSLVFLFLKPSQAANNSTQCTCPNNGIRLQVGLPVPGLISSKVCTEGGETQTIYCVKGLVSYIQAFYKLFISLVGILAVIMIMVGGFQWLLAAGNAQKISGAKTTIVSALMGLILALSSYTILYIVNPQILKLNLHIESANLGQGTAAGVWCTSDMQPILQAYGDDKPMCGTKYRKGNGEDGYCDGFVCDGSKVCLKYKDSYACQGSIHINDTTGYGDYDYESRGGGMCGDIYIRLPDPNDQGDQGDHSFYGWCTPASSIYKKTGYCVIYADLGVSWDKSYEDFDKEQAKYNYKGMTKAGKFKNPYCVPLWK